MTQRPYYRYTITRRGERVIAFLYGAAVMTVSALFILAALGIAGWIEGWQ
jgi:hypothetical protein